MEVPKEIPVKKHTPRKIRLLAVALILFAQPVLAQMGTGRVSGTVKDPAGNPIEGATITAQAGDSARVLEATSDDSGRWAILGFRSRAYDFSVQAPGFMPYNYQAPMKQAGKNPDMDLVLEPAQMGQSAGTGGGLLAEAQELHQAGRFEEALVKYDEVLAQDPTVYQINLNRGAVFRELNRLDEAKVAYQRVLEEEQDNPGAHVALADMAVKDGDLDTAVTHFEAAISATDDEIIPFNVAQIYFQNGEMDKAIEFYAEASDRRMDWAEPPPADRDGLSQQGRHDGGGGAPRDGDRGRAGQRCGNEGGADPRRLAEAGIGAD